MARNDNPVSLLIEMSKRESLLEFKDQMEQSMLFRRKVLIRRFSINHAIKTGPDQGLYVEFGVAAGDGCRLFGRTLAPHGVGLTGFDSFEGLEENWTGIDSGLEAGAFTQDGNLPEVPKNVTLLKGWVQDTLPGYLDETGTTPFTFIHMDMDTYTPTRYALEAVKSRLVKGSVILFDELYGYPGWRHHEYKALNEVLDPDSYEYIAFSSQDVAIQML